VLVAVVVGAVVAVGDGCGGGELVPLVLHAETAAAVRSAAPIAAGATRWSSCRDTRAGGPATHGFPAGGCWSAGGGPFGGGCEAGT
jgi:hypothetical protein